MRIEVSTYNFSCSREVSFVKYLNIMNLKNLFQDFNPSKFVVYSCLLVFTVLFSLKLDGTLEWSYGFVFFPIWVWKLMVMLGAFVGCLVWIRNPQYRQESGSLIQFKAMLLSCAEHLALLMFDVMVVMNLESSASDRDWHLVFIPLFILSVFCIGACIWCVKNDRSYELELFFAVNVLQFIFLSLQLDDIIQWSWVIVFIPIWIVMCVAMIGLLYTVTWTIILVRSARILQEQRRRSITTTVGYSLLAIPLLVFEILLVNRLDKVNDLDFITVSIPLLISFLSLISMAFGSKGGNCWWFGIHKDFCLFLLGVCPCLQEYGNISYSLQRNDQDNSQDQREQDRWTSGTPDVKIISKSKKIGEEVSRTVVPVLSIDMPD